MSISRLNKDLLNGKISIYEYHLLVSAIEKNQIKNNYVDDCYCQSKNNKKTF